MYVLQTHRTNKASMNKFWKRLNCYGMNSPTGRLEIESRPTTATTTIIAPITDILARAQIRPQSKTKPSICRVQTQNRRPNLSTKSDLSASQTPSTIRLSTVLQRWVPRIVLCSTTQLQLRLMRQSQQVQAPHNTKSTASRALNGGGFPKEFRPLRIGEPKPRESKMEALVGWLALFQKRQV